MADEIISRFPLETDCSKQHWPVVVVIRRRISMAAAMMLMVTVSATAHAQFQAPRLLSPLDETAHPGQIAAWQTAIHGPPPSAPQVLRIELPSTGTAQVFADASGSTRIGAVTPVQFAVSPRHLYRLELAEMPEFPGVSLYPTVELIGEIHPPANREQDFPIPIIFAEDEIRLALNGQLVTRIIYVEPPQEASTGDPMRRVIPRQVRAGENLIERADQLGRPIAIVRIGGRRPSMLGVTQSGFYGNGGHVDGPFAAPERLTTDVAAVAPLDLSAIE